MNSQDLINLQESYLDVYEAYGELPKRKISGKLIRTATKGGAKIATAVGIYGGESAIGELGDAPEELAGRFVEGGIKDLSRARRMRQTMRTHSPEAAQRKEQENRNRPPGQKRSRPVGFGEGYMLKTFREFLEEATNRQFHSSKESLLKAHGGELPAGYRPGYRAGKGWFSSSLEDEKASKKRREERKKPLTKKDFEGYAKRNLIKNPREFADIADDRERHAISQKEKERGRRRERFGIEYHVDHIQPLSQSKRKPENQKRFYAVVPGHSNRNLELRTKVSNIRKGETPPRRGEHGSTFTRSGAIRHTANDTKEFIKNLDSTVGNVQGKPAQRMARAYDRLTGLSSR